ncbi:MAG: hypothetical protein FWD37_05885, partial [Methanomassiliicoccaceae archaeon]|nr:hypothetical protein [Methanomassiliicoccaceae archaeon]
MTSETMIIYGEINIETMIHRENRRLATKDFEKVSPITSIDKIEPFRRHGGVEEIFVKPFSKEPIDVETERPNTSRPMCRNRILTADERGDMGRTFGRPKGYNSSKTMILVLTETDNANELLKIATRYPPDTRVKDPNKRTGELKYHSSENRIREEAVMDMATLDPNVYILTLRKSAEKAIKRGSRIYRENMAELIDEYMKLTDAENLFVVIDDSTFLNDTIGVELMKNTAKRHGKNLIRYIQAISENELILWPQ